MVDYNPLDSRFLTTANAITRNGQKFVRIILDIQDNIFYTLDDDGNFNPIGSGGTASSGVTSINVGIGLSSNTSTGAVTIINTGVTGSGLVDVLNGISYFPIWTATTPSSSAVTSTQLTYLNSFYKVNNGGIISNDQFVVNNVFSIGIVNGYSFPTTIGNAGDILRLNNAAPPNALEFVSTTTILPENLYGNVNGDTYTLTGLTANTWSVYEGTWTRIINNGISVSFNPPAISINDPLYNGHILMFNVTGEINATQNHAVEIGWSWNDQIPTIIAGSNQVTHLRSGVPVGNFNCNFLAEISQGSNDFYLFARNITDNTDITLTNINVVITTVYSPNA
jgi:hypothetical protein